MFPWNAFVPFADGLPLAVAPGRAGAHHPGAAHAREETLPRAPLFVDVAKQSPGFRAYSRGGRALGKCGVRELLLSAIESRPSRGTLILPEPPPFESESRCDSEDRVPSRKWKPVLMNTNRNLGGDGWSTAKGASNVCAQPRPAARVGTSGEDDLRLKRRPRFQARMALGRGPRAKLPDFPPRLGPERGLLRRKPGNRATANTLPER